MRPTRRRTAMVHLKDDLKVYSQVLMAATHRALDSSTPEQLATYTSLLGAIRARHWNKVVESVESLDMQSHSSVQDLYVKTQLVALVKKFPFTPDELKGFDPEQTAWKKFLQSEHRCKRQNQRFGLLRYGVGFTHGDLLIDARRYIRKVLGSSPNLPRIYAQCDWGPGANVGVSGDRTNLARKFLARKWSVTRLALSYCTEALWSNDQLRHLILPGRGGIVCLDREVFSRLVRERVQLVTSNNVNFVPKTFKTFRSIASEPLLNGFLQKGIDNEIRNRLRTIAKIDLSDQLENQRLAQAGSRGGFNPYCTLDLSSASDSISIAVARLLLPSDWFELLNSARSHQYSYRGSVRTYEKFVSMGNGFCFPLQTLIFSAIAYAVSVRNGALPDFRVYGDDIIVRQSEALVVIEVLRYLGFKTNPDKTFIFGAFRESCGADWYSGLDIRPVYLDYRFTSSVDLYKFHNSTLRGTFCSSFFDEIRLSLRNACPPEVRFVRPYHGNADGCFTVALDEAMSCQHVTWNRRTQNWSWLEVSTTSVRDRLWGVDPSLANALEYLAVLRGSSSRVPLSVRRKARVRLRRKSYWAVPGNVPWIGAEPTRGVSPL